MLTEEHIKEGLSKSYVSAITNKAGMNCEVNGREFDYGIDGSLIDVKVMRGGRRCEIRISWWQRKGPSTYWNGRPS